MNIITKLLSDYSAFGEYETFGAYGAFGGLYNKKSCEELTKEEPMALYYKLQEIADELSHKIEFSQGIDVTS